MAYDLKSEVDSLHLIMHEYSNKSLVTLAENRREYGVFLRPLIGFFLTESLDSTDRCLLFSLLKYGFE
jgi:hypothetical protein